MNINMCHPIYGILWVSEVEDVILEAPKSFVAFFYPLIGQKLEL